MSFEEKDENCLEARPDTLLPVACGLALATLVPVALRQLQIIEHLPDPASAIFDSDAITGSKQAHPFGVPDAVLGLGSYGATLALALMARRAKGQRGMASSLLGAKLLVDGSAAAFNSVRQVVSFRKLCSWCMGTVVATAVMVYAGRRSIARVLPR